MPNIPQIKRDKHAETWRTFKPCFQLPPTWIKTWLSSGRCRRSAWRVTLGMSTDSRGECAQLPAPFVRRTLNSKTALLTCLCEKYWKVMKTNWSKATIIFRVICLIAQFDFKQHPEAMRLFSHFAMERRSDRHCHPSKSGHCKLQLAARLKCLQRKCRQCFFEPNWSPKIPSQSFVLDGDIDSSCALDIIGRWCTFHLNNLVQKRLNSHLNNNSEKNYPQKTKTDLQSFTLVSSIGSCSSVFLGVVPAFQSCNRLHQDHQDCNGNAKHTHFSWLTASCMQRVQPAKTVTCLWKWWGFVRMYFTMFSLESTLLRGISKLATCSYTIHQSVVPKSSFKKALSFQVFLGLCVSPSLKQIEIYLNNGASLLKNWYHLHPKPHHFHPPKIRSEMRSQARPAKAKDTFGSSLSDCNFLIRSSSWTEPIPSKRRIPHVKSWGFWVVWG